MRGFDHIEERRDLVVGLEYEEWHERRLAADDEMRAHFESAYDLDNPKHSRYHELAAEVWDSREKFASRPGRGRANPGEGTETSDTS